MQLYDIIMLVVMGGSILFGLWKGLAWQIASLAAIFVSYFVSRSFYPQVAEIIGGDPAWNGFLAMFILFMGTSLVVWLMFGFVRNTIEKLHLSSFDKQAGGALGAIKGAILCTLVTLFSVSLLGESVCKNICTSFSGNYIARVLDHTGGLIPDEIKQHIKPHIDKFNEEFDEHQKEQQLDPTIDPNLNPGQFNPGQFDPITGQWQGQGMTQNGGPQERVGQLQRTPSNSNTGTNNGNVFNGQFQLPSIEDLRNQVDQAVGDTAKRAAQQALQDAWNRIQNGGNR